MFHTVYGLGNTYFCVAGSFECKFLPALRREGMATQRTRSSRSRHCLAMRMATKVARESWKDKSLTWRIRVKIQQCTMSERRHGNTCIYGVKNEVINRSKITTHIYITEQIIETTVAVVGGAAESLEDAEPLRTQRATVRRQLSTQDPDIVHPESTSNYSLIKRYKTVLI